jgi:hypothetical protein
MKTEEARYRQMLSPDELLRYATIGVREPLRLPAFQAARLHKLLDDIAAERTGTGAAWRVDRSAYRHRPVDGAQDRMTA